MSTEQNEHQMTSKMSTRKLYTGTCYGLRVPNLRPPLTKLKPGAGERGGGEVPEKTRPPPPPPPPFKKKKRRT